jgi:hypothetical protein
MTQGKYRELALNYARERMLEGAFDVIIVEDDSLFFTSQPQVGKAGEADDVAGPWADFGPGGRVGGGGGVHGASGVGEGGKLER